MRRRHGRQLRHLEGGGAGRGVGQVLGQTLAGGGVAPLQGDEVLRLDVAHREPGLVVGVRLHVVVVVVVEVLGADADVGL